MNKIFIVSGPTCSGKDYLVGIILNNNPSWQKLTTMTSRPKRSVEDRASYRFFSDSQFKKMIDDSKMFEWAKVHGFYYGNSQEYINKVLAQKEPVIGDVDIQGAKTYKQKLGKRVVLIFLKAKNLSVVKDRIIKRNRGESSEEIKIRLDRAKEELRHQHDFDYVVVNKEGKAEEAAKEIEKIVRFEIEK